jgi:hypothetical protein
MDLVPVFVHYAAMHDSIYSNLSEEEICGKYGIRTQEAFEFYLYGYGASIPRIEAFADGRDFFNSMPAVNETGGGKFDNIHECFIDIPDLVGGVNLDSSVDAGGQYRVESTGYPKSEYDPWTGGQGESPEPERPTVETWLSGPDGVPDWIIIEVTGGNSVMLPPL